MDAECLCGSGHFFLRRSVRGLYQRAHVAQYWIVDLDARLLERWGPDDDRPELLSERIEWQPTSKSLPLVIDLAAYFRRVLSD